MKIKIKQKPSFDLLKSIAGQWIEVETDCLFSDQYNTVPFEGCELGVRVHDRDVEKVIDDARLGMGKCNYCGTMLKKGQICSKYETASLEKEHLERTCKYHGTTWFTPTNTYFLAHPEPNSIRIILSDV